jgi:hypothetical protein
MPIDPAARDPLRVKAFATFFKNYMSVSAVVTAALPVPITAWGLIPVYDAQKGELATYTSLFCFLILAFVFYVRHSLARVMFPEVSPTPPSRVNVLVVKYLPFLLIALAFVSALTYRALLMMSLGLTKDSTVALRETRPIGIPLGDGLFVLYLFIFIFAETAFVLMAMREYLQDVLSLTDRELIETGRFSNQQRGAP